jgi:hypothetical protein
VDIDSLQEQAFHATAQEYCTGKLHGEYCPAKGVEFELNYSSFAPSRSAQLVRAEVANFFEIYKAAELPQICHHGFLATGLTVLPQLRPFVPMLSDILA